MSTSDSSSSLLAPLAVAPPWRPRWWQRRSRRQALLWIVAMFAAFGVAVLYVADKSRREHELRQRLQAHQTGGGMVLSQGLPVRVFGKSPAEVLVEQARMLIQLGNEAAAMETLREALRTEPDLLQARLLLAGLLATQGEGAAAVVEYRVALQLDPGNIVALNNLADLLSSHPDPAVRDGALAVAFAEQAVALAGAPHPALLGTLASAYAEVARWDDAVVTARRAIELAEAAGAAALAAELRIQSRWYEAGLPFRDAKFQPLWSALPRF